MISTLVKSDAAHTGCLTSRQMYVPGVSKTTVGSRSVLSASPSPSIVPDKTDIGISGGVGEAHR